MARKKKHEEHENLERWLVSYADFMTLLFATFVVLYALAQVDVAAFSKMEDSIKKAFDSSTILSGNPSIMEDVGQNVIGQGANDSVAESLLMEYLSQKYEEDSFEQIKQSIDQMKKNKELTDVDVTIDSRGLVITLKDSNLIFEPGSAKLTDAAKLKLDKITALIGRKFMMHQIKIEGHTDSMPINSIVYPSNWELSAARSCTIIRFMIDKYKFLPQLFSAIGFSDTRPIDKEKTQEAFKKNRRIEIIVVKNRHKTKDNFVNPILSMDKKTQNSIRQQQLEAVNRILSVDYVNEAGSSKNRPKIRFEGNTNIEQGNLRLDENLYKKESERLENKDILDVELKSRN